MSIIKRLFGMSASDAEPTLFSIDPSTLAAAQCVERGKHCACLASRTKKGTPSVPNLHTEAQDITATGWLLLQQLISSGGGTSSSVLEPSATIPPDQWSAVITLPPTVANLSAVASLRLYGSHLRRLPSEIGRMSALTNLDIYTSYSLHWLPYEVTRLTALRDSRMSTRALYGNLKTRLPFPRLAGPVDTIMPQTCSVCNQPFGENGPQLFWTTQRIATDVAPLLIHSCSAECTAHVPDAPDGYYPRPHRGGGGVGMPAPDLD